jgi:proteasome assembly chaperone (PAC2) family protein
MFMNHLLNEMKIKKIIFIYSKYKKKKVLHPDESERKNLAIDLLN